MFLLSVSRKFGIILFSLALLLRFLTIYDYMHFIMAKLFLARLYFQKETRGSIFNDISLCSHDIFLFCLIFHSFSKVRLHYSVYLKQILNNLTVHLYYAVNNFTFANIYSYSLVVLSSVVFLTKEADPIVL